MEGMSMNKWPGYRTLGYISGMSLLMGNEFPSNISTLFCFAFMVEGMFSIALRYNIAL